MLNLDTGSAIALVAQDSLVRHLLRQYIGSQQMVMTQTAVAELSDIIRGVAGQLETARYVRFLQIITVINDNPSPRALTLKPTRRLGENDIIILGSGDRLGIVTLTADSKAVKAALAQGVDFSVYLHAPYPLKGC